MQTSCYKLCFSTPVHFGSESGGELLTDVRYTCRADTVFSALFHTALAMGESETLYKAVAEDCLWFSDAFPFDRDQYYLPKPIGIWDQTRKEGDPSVRKLLKRVAYIPAGQLHAYLHGQADPRALQCSFGESFEQTRVNKRRPEDALPYQVGGFRFQEGCGLYLLAKAENARLLAQLSAWLTILGMTGIGGKVSSGWGKFTVESVETPPLLDKGLKDQAAARYLLLSTALPLTEEMDTALADGQYLVVRRGGYAYSESSPPKKKHTVYLLDAGSTFSKPFTGCMIDVGRQMPHPVWRCAKAGFLGVNV